MFLVCPSCAEYSDDRPVVDGCIACSCGHRYAHRLLPAFFVTGASGSGKSTICHALTGEFTSLNVLDSDILWSPAMDTPEDGYARWRFTWLRMIANLNQSGRSTLLFAGGIPSSFGASPMAKYVGRIHWLALVCDDEALAERLRVRPSWRKSAAPDVIRTMQEFNAHLRAAADCAHLDTTNLSVTQAAEWIRSWVNEGLTSSAL